jgi:hypothetical protein
MSPSIGEEFLVGLRKQGDIFSGYNISGVEV